MGDCWLVVRFVEVLGLQPGCFQCATHRRKKDHIKLLFHTRRQDRNMNFYNLDTGFTWIGRTIYYHNSTRFPTGYRIFFLNLLSFGLQRDYSVALS